MKLCTRLFSALVVVAASLTTAEAQLYWDINGTTAGATDNDPDATGSWDDITTNWNPVADGTGTTQLWDDASLAVFAAGGDATGPYTVTVVGTQTAAGITFEDSFISIPPITLTGGQVNLTAPTITVPADEIVRILSAIGGAAGLTSTGAGVLELGGTNVYTGDTRVAVGNTIRLASAGAIPDTSLLVLENGNANTSFRLNGINETVKSLSNGGTTGTVAKIYLGANTLTLANTEGETNGALFETLTGPGGTQGGVAGDFSSPHGTIVKSGAGGLAVNGASGGFIGGEFQLEQGSVTIGSNNAFGTAPNGGKLVINPNNRPEGVSLSKTVGGATGAITMNTAYVDVGGNFTLTPTGTTATNGRVTWQWAGNGAGGAAGTPGQAANGRVLFTLTANNSEITFDHPYSDNVGVDSGHVIFDGTIRDDFATSGLNRGLTLTGGGTFTMTGTHNSYHGDTTITDGSVLRLTSINVTNHVGPAHAGNQDSNAGQVGTINLSGGTLSTAATIGAAATLGPRQNIVANPLNMVGDNSITWTVNDTFSATPETNMDFVFTSNSVTGSGTLTIQNRSVAVANTNNKVFRAIFNGSGNDFNYSGDIVVNHNTGTPATRTTQLVFANTSGTQTWVGDISGTGALVRNAVGGTTVLNGANTYAGGTLVQAGTLRASGSSATFGDGDITVSGGLLEIAGGVLDAIDDTASLTVMTGGIVSLGTGVNDIIAALTLDGNAFGAGTYGHSTSGASNPGLATPDTYFAAGLGILTVPAQGLAGDYNEDDIVDAADYVMWRKRHPDPTGPALPNDPSSGVDTDDYARWVEKFGESTPGSGGGNGSSGQVPEPASAALALLAMAALGGWRWHRG